ncbi:unnamed protein product, partial [Echinostoma caproni]|uniref:Clathrin coat assembly protein AP180 n=1 Tax=Echinostoma caproni TaxID=27848 RepID=A0A183B1E0_9TREM
MTITEFLAFTIGLNEPGDTDGGASPICGSPFAGDEKIVEPATGVEDWPEATDGSQSKFDAQFGTPQVKSTTTPTAPAQTTTGSSIMDDLLGLDLLGPESGDATPITVPTPVAPIIGSNVGAKPTTATGTTNDNPAKPAFALDDLLSLDPLLGSMDPVPPTSAPAPITQLPETGGSIHLPP